MVRGEKSGILKCEDVMGDNFTKKDETIWEWWNRCLCSHWGQETDFISPVTRTGCSLSLLWGTVMLISYLSLPIFMGKLQVVF